MAPTFKQSQEIIRRAAHICPTCRHTYADPDNVESIEKGYECLYCDHIREEQDHLLSKFI